MTGSRGDLVAGMFSPPERWGWEFAPPASARPAPELHRPPMWQPPPAPNVAALAWQRQRVIHGLWKPLLVAGLFLLFGLSIVSASAGGGLFLIVIGLAIAGFANWPVYSLRRRMETITEQAAAELSRRQHEYQQLHGAWQDRVARHDHAEAERVDQALLFFPLDAAPAPRVDVFGGTGAGWTSLLATAGSSLLADGSGILLLDLGERGVGAGLVLMTNAASGLMVDPAGFPVEVHELPDAGWGLDGLGLFDGLGPADAADLLADAVDGDRRDGGDPALRAIDGDILAGVTARIADRLTVGRVAAALRVLDNSDDAFHDAQLSGQEIAALQQRMHSLGQRDRVADQVRFLRTAVETLCGRQLAGGADQPGQPGWTVPPAAPGEGVLRPVTGLRVLATSSREGSTRRKDLSDRVLVQAVLSQLRRRRPAGFRETLVVAGADHLGRAALAGLTRHAEVAGVRLVLMFERLTDEAERLLGSHGSAAIFMRLGNAKEASTAADFIGKGYRFTLSQLTEQVGKSFAEGTGNSYGTQVGTSESSGRSGGSSHGPGGASGNRGWNTSTTTSHSETWQRTDSFTETTSTNDGTTYQRVHEYAVEPTILQALPTTAFILVGTGDGGGRVRSGDCNPGTVLLPKVSAVPRGVEGAPRSPQAPMSATAPQPMVGPGPGYPAPYPQAPAYPQTQQYPQTPQYPQTQQYPQTPQYPQTRPQPTAHPYPQQYPQQPPYGQPYPPEPKQ